MGLNKKRLAYFTFSKRSVDSELRLVPGDELRLRFARKPRTLLTLKEKKRQKEPRTIVHSLTHFGLVSFLSCLFVLFPSVSFLCVLVLAELSTSRSWEGTGHVIKISPQGEICLELSSNAGEM